MFALEDLACFFILNESALLVDFALTLRIHADFVPPP
jgi:hypothetical protein